MFSIFSEVVFHTGFLSISTILFSLTFLLETVVIDTSMLESPLSFTNSNNTESLFLDTMILATPDADKTFFFSKFSSQILDQLPMRKLTGP